MGTLGFDFSRSVRVGGQIGIMSLDTGRGGDDDFPSVEELFSSEEVPALDQQPDYLITAGFLEVERRDNPEDPRRGSYLLVKWARHHDRKLARFSFQEVGGRASRFVPLSRRSVLALRVDAVLTSNGMDQKIPFFFLPALGGTESLHGFDNQRFRDRHSLLFNVEYRWELTPALRAELLLDSGQVFSSERPLELGRFEFSYGTGLRLKMGRGILVGASLGLGREGARISVRGDFRF
jgi:outer membrane translocation and assembly module TamA